MDFSSLMSKVKPALGGLQRGIAGGMSGFGKGMMDRGFKTSFEEGATGGYQDLMGSQKAGDFVRTGGRQKSGQVFGGGKNTLGIADALFNQTSPTL